MTFRYYTLIYDEIKSKLSSIVDFAFKEGTKLSLVYLTMVQHTGGKQKEDLVSVKHHLKQL